MKSNFIYILCFCFSVLLSQAQVKEEREFRIDKAQFPASALALLESLPKNHKRVKFYKELDGTQVSYEAKVKIKRRLYSIEFDADGQLQDIEILIKKKDLGKHILSKITSYLDAQYDHHSLLKIQKQYVKLPEVSANNLLQNALEDDPESAVNYEIIIEVKQQKKHQLQEMTFDFKGQFLFSRIVKASAYEHILY